MNNGSETGINLRHNGLHWATKKLEEKNKAIRLANEKKTIKVLKDESLWYLSKLLKRSPSNPTNPTTKISNISSP